MLGQVFFSFHFHNENHPQTSAEDFGIGSTPTTELPTLPLELQAFKDNAKVQKTLNKITNN